MPNPFPLDIVHDENKITECTAREQVQVEALQKVIDDIFFQLDDDVKKVTNNSLNARRNQELLDDFESKIFTVLMTNRRMYRKVFEGISSVKTFDDYRKIIRITISNASVSSKVLGIQ